MRVRPPRPSSTRPGNRSCAACRGTDTAEPAEPAASALRSSRPLAGIRGPACERVLELLGCAGLSGRGRRGHACCAIPSPPGLLVAQVAECAALPLDFVVGGALRRVDDDGVGIDLLERVLRHGVEAELGVHLLEVVLMGPARVGRSGDLPGGRPGMAGENRRLPLPIHSWGGAGLDGSPRGPLTPRIQQTIRFQPKVQYGVPGRPKPIHSPTSSGPPQSPSSPVPSQSSKPESTDPPGCSGSRNPGRRLRRATNPLSGHCH